jgi:RNA polymerase sigma-70 factor, ECF subfamily
MDENQAIERLKQGDVRGLELLVRTYYLPAVRAAYLIVQDPDLAQDIVQNAFINLPVKISQFDETRAFRPWFLRSIVNSSISAGRKGKREISLDAADDSNASFEKLIQHTGEWPSPEDSFLRAELRTAVWQALQQLQPQERAAIVLRYYLELSENELSTELKRPKSTIKWLLFSARRKLRQLLEPWHENDNQSKFVQQQEERL